VSSAPESSEPVESAELVAAEPRVIEPARPAGQVAVQAAAVAATSFVVRPRPNGPSAVRDILCATSQTLTAAPLAVGVPPSPTVVHLLNALRLVHA